jgi:hypothetical protein
MKIIVNSKTLAARIRQALEWDCNSISHDERSERTIIIFSNETHSVEIGCAIREISDPIKVYRISWYRVMKLCKSIPEQPITVVIMDQSIDVYCEHQFKSINTLS